MDEFDRFLPFLPGNFCNFLFDLQYSKPLQKRNLLKTERICPFKKHFCFFLEKLRIDKGGKYILTELLHLKMYSLSLNATHVI